MRRTAFLRTLTLALAFLHTLPARKHLVAFIAAPSWTEGWKGIGAAVAVALYLLPVERRHEDGGDWNREEGGAFESEREVGVVGLVQDVVDGTAIVT
jgi:hypothetical protein